MGKPKKTAREPERDDSASEPYSDELDVSSPEVLDFGTEGEVLFNSDWQEEKGSEDDDDDDEEQGDQKDAEDDWGTTDDDEKGDERVKNQLRTVSFGSLAKAQDSLGQGSKKRKRTDKDDNEETLAALRKRLKELQESNGKGNPKKTQLGKSASHSRRFTGKDEEASDGSASAPDDYASHSRSSKHAPTIQTSKHTVSRKRNVVSVPKASGRDPRFDLLTGSMDSEKIRKNYKFLDDYVDSEIKELKTALKGHKVQDSEGSDRRKKKKGNKLTPEEAIALKKELTQKESKRATQEAKDREREVQSEHRKREKEMIKQGKKPFFLKKTELKKQVLVKRFEGMSEGKRDKIIEKKRRRMATKERKSMPTSRRV
jgi:ribosomal RNA-processing protein 36